MSPLVGARARQRPDGSWGAGDDARRRVLPTLWTVAVLAELGAVDDEAWHDGVRFLAAHASTDDGVFSRDGRPAGVLSCYVAIAASTYVLGGRLDLAAPQVEWILRHQDVREHGVSRRGDVEVYHPALAHRYGGCLASTSCLIGVVKAGRALDLWRRSAGAEAGAARRAEVDRFLAVVRDALLARRLWRTRAGRVLPLGTPPARAEEWLVPTFPLDWRTDLIEVLDLVLRTGTGDGDLRDERLAPALERLAGLQRDDGGWPLLRSFWQPGFPALEPRSARRSSRLATARVVRALGGA